MQTEISLYERLGGEAALAVAVDEFYRRVVHDPMLAPFFNGIEMARLRSHQHAFLSQILGGPRQYSGVGLRKAHSRLNLTMDHFNAVAGHLAETLQSLGIEQGLIDEVVAGLVPLADQVVAQAPPQPPPMSPAPQPA